jgi:ribosomal protein S18 acetylase RimI-like enzyme
MASAKYVSAMPLRRSSARSTITKSLTRIKSRGPKEVVDLAGRRLVEFLHSEDRIIFFALPLSPPLPRHPAPTNSVFRRATVEDAAAYARDIGTDSEDSFVERLSRDTHCYLVMTDELIVHATWVTTSAAWTREVRRYFKPPLGEAYIYESFTRAEARGQGAYPFALVAIAEELAGDGIRRMWVGVEAGNTPSIKAVRKAGFEPGFEITYNRRLGRLTVSRPRGPLAPQCAKCLTRTGSGQISA